MSSHKGRHYKSAAELGLVPAAKITRIEQPDEIRGYDELYPTVAKSEVQIRTTYKDRAEGFQIAIKPLSTIMGFLSVIVAVMGIGVPFFDLAIIAWFGTAFCITWAFGWAFNQFVSPDGATLLSALLGYRLIRHEQQQRHKREDNEYR